MDLSTFCLFLVMRGHQPSVSQCHADNDHDFMIVHISQQKEWNWSIFIALIINHHNHCDIINYCHNSYPVKAVGAIWEDLRWNMRILLGESCVWKELFFLSKFRWKGIILFEEILQVLVNVHQGCLNLKRCNEECRLVYFPTFHFIMLEYCKIGLFRRQKWFAELRSQVFLYHFHVWAHIWLLWLLWTDGQDGQIPKSPNRLDLFLIDRSIYQLSCIFWWSF